MSTLVGNLLLYRIEENLFHEVVAGDSGVDAVFGVAGIEGDSVGCQHRGVVVDILEISTFGKG